MKFKLTTAIILLATTLILFSTLSFSRAQDHTLSYQLLNQPEGNITYELNVAIPDYLHEYYEEKSHRLTSSNGFPIFVTPYALQPLADRLWEIYNDEEDYANGVLMIAHQITYVETAPAKYPVETMVDAQGDCDLFSFIAASIMKAGGLDVVLLYYEEQNHMNIGVHLSSAPEDARDSVYYFTQDSERYYVAECTGGNWKAGWRVGECPTDLKQVSAEIVTLDNAEQLAPGQVSASFKAMEPSALSLEVSPIISIQNSVIVVGGQLSPEMANENVILYAQINSSPWTVIGTALTQSDGRFEYVWMPEAAGSHAIRAGWSGNDLYTGAMSSTKSATVIPLFLTALIGVAVIAVVVGTVAVFIARRTQHQSLETPEPQPW
ncbi:MAG: Ig-like domain-containing protein [Candidatus Bathyarchaeia archaeon]|nr:Ig-like domain-containing protein [Candidatus Bathyarchaeia archaeon]